MSTERTITVEVKTAHEGWCNGCDVDESLYRLNDVYEALRRPRAHLRVGQSVTVLCPDCAKKIRAALFEFSA